MTFGDWVQESKARIKSDGLEGVNESAYELWIGVLRRAECWADPGLNYYDREWDVLVILDATRVDAMKAVADEYDFVDAIETVRSPGSATYQWLQRTFTEEYTDEMVTTTYVTGNPFTEHFLDADDFERLDEVWKYAWSDESNTVPARAITDRAIEIAREESPDRMILHYMQPHFPSVPEPLDTDRRPPDQWGDDTRWESPWKKQRKGKLDADTVWESYLANLRYVMDDVALLRENVDAEKLVITADHGNAKGEWGVYDHPNVPLDCLREVPWVTTDATDTGSHDPADYTRQVDGSTEDRLKQLGYM